MQGSPNLAIMNPKFFLCQVAHVDPSSRCGSGVMKFVSIASERVTTHVYLISLCSTVRYSTNYHFVCSDCCKCCYDVRTGTGTETRTFCRVALVTPAHVVARCSGVMKFVSIASEHVTTHLCLISLCSTVRYSTDYHFVSDCCKCCCVVRTGTALVDPSSRCGSVLGCDEICIHRV